jgi:nitrite reductase/ring-hydroxylating ferredoxin subunit
VQITASDDRHGVCITCPYHKSKFSLEEDGKCKVWSESVLGIKGMCPFPRS